MFFTSRYKLLNEEASAELLDSKKADEVVEDLEEVMESIPEDNEELVTNGGIQFTAEMCSLLKCEAAVTGKKKKVKDKYCLELAVLSLFMESENVKDAADAVDKVVDAHNGTPDPDTKEIVEIDKADIVIIAPSEEEVKEIIDDAVQEAKISKGKKGPAQKKAADLLGALEDLKEKGIKVVKKTPKRKK